MTVSAISVTEMLKYFGGFAPALKLHFSSSVSEGEK